LGIPAQVTNVNGIIGKIDYGGVQREVNLSLLEDVSPGEYVLVHAGYAIQKVDEKEALETLRILQEITALAEEETQ